MNSDSLGRYCVEVLGVLSMALGLSAGAGLLAGLLADTVSRAL